MKLLVSRSVAGTGKPKAVKMGMRGVASRKTGKTRAVKVRPVKGKYTV